MIAMTKGKNKMNQTFKILHLTDFHLFNDPQKKLAGIKPFETLKYIISDIQKDLKKNTPDLVIIGGDVSQDFSPESYETVNQLIKPFKCPVLSTMGNHDDLENFSKIFGSPTEIFNEPKLSNWKVIILDSFWQKHVGGKLNEKDLEFLKKNLDKDPKQPVIIFLHHHVLPIDSMWLDKINLNDNHLFLDLIDQYQNIKAVVCGHIHQDTKIIRDGVEFYSTPSTCWQFKPKSPGFKIDEAMPGYRWIYLKNDGTFTTKVIRVKHNGDFVPDIETTGY
jgi:3',5'-cyclic-AMP phosphodiesterase